MLSDIKTSHRGGKASMTVKDIKNLDELLKTLNKLGPDMAKRLAKPINESVNAVAERARTNARQLDNVNQGDHVNLVDAVKTDNAQTFNEGLVKGFKVVGLVYMDESAQHATAVELGHKFSGYLKGHSGRVKAKPYLRPAALKSKRSVERLIATELSKLIKEVGGKP